MYLYKSGDRIFSNILKYLWDDQKRPKKIILKIFYGYTPYEYTRRKYAAN